VLLIFFAAAAAALEARVWYLQLIHNEFLAAQGDDRQVRTVEISAHRGDITDRHGEPLAASTPVDSIWANPRQVTPALDRLPELARALELDPEWLARRITSNVEREFVYLKRHLTPAQAAAVLELDMPGIGTTREYGRYYPAGEIAGHVIGFTDIDDNGQEGLELAFDYWLRGEAGSKRVRQDRFGRVVDDVEQIQAPRPGRTLRTSLDLRLQYLAYRELKLAVGENLARSGSVVVLDPHTGEVLAMANQPSFNPNNRAHRDPALYRNLGATDLFEPGSSFKPFVLAAALESGHVAPDTLIDTSPGYLTVGGRKLTEDPTRLGLISVTGILAKSSNVGAGRIALELAPETIARTLQGFGIGRSTESGFPGESAGVLHDARHWREVGQATLAYGYGLSVTTLQLARAYAAIAADGVLRPVSMLALDARPAGERVISATTAAQLLDMMQAVISPEGTGQRAAVRNYTVAGKTGTSRISSAEGYSASSSPFAARRYTAVFAGIAPAADPRLVIAVVIDDPQGREYYGGDVAAPVFARIAAGAMRLLAVPPDALAEPPMTVVAHAQVGP